MQRRSKRGRSEPGRARGRQRSGLRLAGAAALLAAGALGGFAYAEPEAPEPEPAAPVAPTAASPAVSQGGAVPLDRLLRLPTGTGQGSELERRGGMTKAEWEARFREARTDQAAAIEAIEKTREAIEKKAAAEGGGQWRMGAPGLGGNLENTNAGDATDNPLDYRLTQQLRRNREELERAERALQDLEVEANLASVPAAWRAPPDEDPDAAR